MTHETGRRLRADAKRNEDLLLAAAISAFTTHGSGASLKAIAQDAGVGIGTLYRRFPTREHLVWAIYRSEVERICDSVPDLLARHAPVAALRTWMEAFLDLLVAKRGMAESLKDALARNDSQRLETRQLLTGALAVLIDAGTDEGVLRSDISPLDVMMALGGTALIAGEPEQHEQATRLLNLLMDGLRQPSASDVAGECPAS